MPINAKIFAEFEALVTTDAEHTEMLCAKYLHYAAALLLPGTPVQISVGVEDRNYFGSTDYVVSASLLDDRGNQANHAYIWELKSPQSYLFEFDDNKNRCRPTKAFIKAENQLLHYATQAQSDQLFRQRFDVLDFRNIRIGGIIIGRNDRMLRDLEAPQEMDKAEMALSIRYNLLYYSQGIRVLTWNRVLEFVRPADPAT